MSKWRKIRRLSGAEISLLAQACLLLPLNAVALHLLGFRRWCRLLSQAQRLPGKPPGTPESGALAEARAAAWIVGLAARNGFYHANCLQQSLTLWWLLLRRGIESELRIGVNKSNQQFEAHAWVEQAGIALNESRDVSQRYSPFNSTFFPLEAESR